MKTRIMLLGIVSGRLSANAQAATKTGDLPATVVRAGNREIPSHSIHAGGSPPHLALQSEIQSPDIGMQAGSNHLSHQHLSHPWRLPFGLSDGAPCRQPRDPGQSHQARPSCAPFPRPSDANGDRESERRLGTIRL
jgi:hypothetical protein